jgi:hypothetical protein
LNQKLWLYCLGGTLPALDCSVPLPEQHWGSVRPSLLLSSTLHMGHLY